MPGPIRYIDPDSVEWSEFRPGSRWRVLFEDPPTAQRAVLIEWDPGYEMAAVDHHERDEVVFVLSGTFVQDGVRSGPGTYIHHIAGSSHQASTPDGCTFLELSTGHPERHGEATEEQLAWFRSLVRCPAPS